MSFPVSAFIPVQSATDSKTLYSFSGIIYNYNYVIYYYTYGYVLKLLTTCNYRSSVTCLQNQDSKSVNFVICRHVLNCAA
jgi:hypothetical protein